jgi:hypothetical protein
VRYYGLFSPAHRPLLHQVRVFLSLEQSHPATSTPTPAPPAETIVSPPPPPPVCCPRCGQPMRWLAEIPPTSRPPPSAPLV